MKVVIGSDHGGFDLKEHVRGILQERGASVEDVGCPSKQSVDYPDYARRVALKVTSGEADEGVLICTTGIGMAMAANRFPGIRAALCLNPYMAKMARNHNNANVLVLGGSLLKPDEARAVVEEWMRSRFSGEARHLRRVGKLDCVSECGVDAPDLAREDTAVAEAVAGHAWQERSTINLIASENYASRAVREAQGSVLTNKYAEGYPGKRYYGGCRFVDAAERLAIDRAKELFGAEHANVQPHCGSSANMAVYFAVLQPGDTILAMNLSHGGHLTHGHAVNFSGRLFKIVSYGVSPKSETIDYDELERLARESRPKMIVAGASAYPRILDFNRFRAIADSVGACLTVDMAHIAGLVAGGVHPSPVPVADFVTTTTHKTLRGPRSGLILCKERYGADVDKQVFPGLQGGPLMHTIASKAVCFHEALRPSFKDYCRQIVTNAGVMASTLSQAGLRLVSGGTDNHLMLVDVSAIGLTGKDASAGLEEAGMIVNKNTIPFDQKSPFVTSGIRIGTPAITTRGMKEPETRAIGGAIVRVLQNLQDKAVLQASAQEMHELALRFPVP